MYVHQNESGALTSDLLQCGQGKLGTGDEIYANRLTIQERLDLFEFDRRDATMQYLLFVSGFIVSQDTVRVLVRGKADP